MNKELEGKMVEILKSFVKKYDGEGGFDWIACDDKGFKDASSRIAALMLEPLAVMADRKGCWIDTHNTRNLSKVVRINFYQQTIGDGRVIAPVEFRAKTYEQAESLAREYLEKLEDVKK